MEANMNRNKDRVLRDYYADNARKLHRVVDRILSGFGGLWDKDLDDFYSLANEVFAGAISRYDGMQSFDNFLYTCLLNRIKTEITRRNREKRRTDRLSVSLDIPIGEDGEDMLCDMLVGDFDVEKAVLEKDGEEYSRKMRLYLDRLSKMQREVLRLDAEGYLPNEIREELHISKRQYTDCHVAIHSYRNVSVLF